MRLGLGAILLGALGLVPAVRAAVTTAECTTAWNDDIKSPLDPDAVSFQIGLTATANDSTCTTASIAFDHTGWYDCCVWINCDYPAAATAGSTQNAYNVVSSEIAWTHYWFSATVECAANYALDPPDTNLDVTKCDLLGGPPDPVSTMAGSCKQMCISGIFGGAGCASLSNTGNLNADIPDAVCATEVCDNVIDLATCCKAAPAVGCGVTRCAVGMCSEETGYCWMATCNQGYHFVRREQKCKADATDEEIDEGLSTGEWVALIGGCAAAAILTVLSGCCPYCFGFGTNRNTDNEVEWGSSRPHLSKGKPTLYV